MKLSLIIPCYNEEEALPYIYEELVKVSATLSDYEIEYLFVNDGSKDHTLDKLKELAAHDERVKYFSFSRNFGKEAAMYAGFCNASGDYVAVMDADLQDSPDEIPGLYQMIKKEGYDLVSGYKQNRKEGDPLSKTGHSFKLILSLILSASCS